LNKFDYYAASSDKFGIVKVLMIKFCTGDTFLCPASFGLFIMEHKNGNLRLGTLDVLTGQRNQTGYTKRA
jgi:hypothetical protein